LFADSAYALPRARSVPTRRFAIEGDIVAGTALLSAALVVGLATVGDYGLTVDEFNTDDYGPKALAWYTSGFTDRSHFENVEDYLWYYGPWFQILIAVVQSFNLANPLTVRHAMNFAIGLVGLAALIPIARLTVGRWAGPVAIGLCLMTGYFYGSLFFTPIDVPFMAAMTWAVLAILVMAKRDVPSWPATVAVGLLTGLAMSTRTGGIISHAYLLGAMSLCALELVARRGRTDTRSLLQIGLRTLSAIAIAWATAIAIWPWLQIGNPLRQFWTAFVHFANIPMTFTFQHWGEELTTSELPRSYIPEQFLARLPEAFLVLLVVGFVLALATALVFVRATLTRWRRDGIAGLRAPALVLARSRGTLLIVAAVVVPVGFLIVKASTLYDGVRHILFVIPMLAMLAGGALLWLLPLLRRYRIVAFAVVVVAGAHVGATLVSLAILHPFQYAAMNSLAGGVSGAADRFELDYWAVGATEALRRLERRLDYDTSRRFASRPPRVLVCMTHRETVVGPLFRRKWVVETDVDKADFIIETERWRCAKGTRATLIDEVKRFDATFAWIYVNNGGRAD